MPLKQINKNIIFCIVTGLLAAFSFPKISLFFLMWAAFVPLISVIVRSSAPVSFFYAFFAGFVFNLQANFWLVDTVHLFAETYETSIIFCLCFNSYFAFYWGAWGFFVSLFKKYSLNNVWVFALLCACAWTLIEYVKANVLTGWPWLSIAYSQYKFLSIVQIVEFTGIYGLSFAIMFINVLLYFGFARRKKRYFAAAAAVFFALLIFGAARYPAFENFGSGPYKFVAAQSNVEQYKKFDNSHINELTAGLEIFADEISKIEHDVVLWSESEIINLIPNDITSYVFADKIAAKAGGMNIIGAPSVDGDGKLYNRVFYFNGKGAYAAAHAKNHLVPFGEYIPFSKSILERMGIYDRNDDSHRGSDTVVFTDKKLYIGALICSENFYPDITRRFILSGAKVFTNHTNDAWFLDSSAPYKHFCANVFRAVESRKDVIIAANTGVSGAVNAAGKIISETKVYERKLLTGTFFQNDYKTFYMLYGDVFAALCVLFIAVFAAAVIYKRCVKKSGVKKN
ncbi:MAG: apolipoprotein N-acyltransferase [Endomicrobium sp.]|jgi:apolipoprotein N-acyltransferase|nr:apolipoprotein N-acyltransferase [Endomicrobium sp.]